MSRVKHQEVMQQMWSVVSTQCGVLSHWRRLPADCCFLHFTRLCVQFIGLQFFTLGIDWL